MGFSQHKTRIELNFFEYSDSKRFFAEPSGVKYDKNNRPQYDLILGTETMKELGIMLAFNAKIIIIDEVILKMRNINHLQGASTLRALKLLSHGTAQHTGRNQMYNADPRHQI
jgi:hypothetical protein